MNKPMHTCPVCFGKKGSVCHHNTGADSGKHYWAWVDCSACDGTGEVVSDTVENIEIGKRLRKARVAAGLSFMDAARKYGVCPATISGIESRGLHHSEAPGFIALIEQIESRGLHHSEAPGFIALIEQEATNGN